MFIKLYLFLPSLLKCIFLKYAYPGSFPCRHQLHTQFKRRDSENIFLILRSLSLEKSTGKTYPEIRKWWLNPQGLSTAKRRKGQTVVRNVQSFRAGTGPRAHLVDSLILKKNKKNSREATPVPEVSRYFHLKDDTLESPYFYLSFSF